MKIYDEQGILTDAPNLEQGWLETVQRVIAHHPAVPEVPAVTHIEVMAGTDGLRHVVVDTPATQAHPAWDEYETVQVYHLYSQEELAERNRPTALAQLRADVDFLAVMGGIAL